jgi:CMP/dCMP kinase
MIITIDGPAGTGKSTVAKNIAQECGFTYFDTGAMYRAISWGILKNNINLDDPVALDTFLKEYPVTVKTHYIEKRYFLGTEEVTDKIRLPEVTKLVSKVSSYRQVRDALVAIQRTLAQGVNAVFEGRDMGTVVFPDADLKIFLTASPEVCAERRFNELIQKHPSLSSTLTQDGVKKDMALRDQQDANRDISPMKPADDAIIIDTSNLTIDDVINKIIVLKEQKERS